MLVVLHCKLVVFGCNLVGIGYNLVVLDYMLVHGQMYLIDCRFVVAVMVVYFVDKHLMKFAKGEHSWAAEGVVEAAVLYGKPISSEFTQYFHCCG